MSDCAAVHKRDTQVKDAAEQMFMVWMTICVSRAYSVATKNRKKHQNKSSFLRIIASFKDEMLPGDSVSCSSQHGT